MSPTGARRERAQAMSLGMHLRELRKRMTFAAASILVMSVAGFFVTDWVIAGLREPVAQLAIQSGRAGLNFSNVTQAFDLRMQIAITVGVVVSSPIWLYQVWAFLVPALVRREKQFAIAFVGSAVPLFLAGCAMGWWVMPHVVQLMLGFVGSQDMALLDAKFYYDFVIKLLLATGIAFVLPVFLVLLNFVGVLSARTILKGWRIAILLICVFTAIATPAADVFSMLVLAAPMVVLYFIACGIAFVHDRRLARRTAEALRVDSADRRTAIR